jgi:nitronate monooxygenase
MIQKNPLGLEFPIIQAPMAGNILPAETIAKISNHGFLGMLPAGYLSLRDLEKLIVDVKSKLKAKNKVIGINLFIENHNQQYLVKNSRVKRLESSIEPQTKFDENFTVPKAILQQDYVDLILKYNIKVVSMTFGLLKDNLIQQLKAKGIKLIASVTNIQEAQLADEKGIDIFVGQGCEAGGHQASFLENDINKNSTKELLQSLRERFPDKCIIASGGISRNNLGDFFELGADYVQLGSVFMMSNESNLSESYRNYICNNFKTIVTKNITGKYARGVVNKLILDSEILEYDFPLQHYHTSGLRKLAKSKDLFELQSLWVGDNHENLKISSLDELIESLKNELSKI